MNLFYDLMMGRNLRYSFAGKKDETDAAHFNIDAMCNTRQGPNINRSEPQFLPI